MFSGVFLVPYYTIPKIKRELKPKVCSINIVGNYTIPKIKRELKQRLSRNGWLLYYTIPKIKRELKHVNVYFRIFSHYTTLYTAYAKPISTFEKLQNVNLAPYENYVLTNDIIEGDARARGARVRVFIKLAEKREWRACGQQIGRMYGQQVGRVCGRAGEQTE